MKPQFYVAVGLWAVSWAIAILLWLAITSFSVEGF